MLDEQERSVLVELMEQTRIVLAPSGGVADLAGDEDAFTVLAASFDPPPQPEADLPPDSALARLLPPGYRGDGDIAEEFRRFTEQDLRIHKATCLATAVRLLRAGEQDRFVVPVADVQAVLVALTDVRLLLADRLELTTEQDVERLEEQLREADPEDLSVYVAEVYDFLGWLQETLVHAVM